MLAPLLTIIVILIAVLIYYLLNYYALKSEFEKIKPMVFNVSLETKRQDMALVYEYMDIAILKTLRYYVNKDLNFGEKSSVNIYIAGHYRDLISFLLNENVVFSDEIDSEIVIRSFMSVFLQRVYLLYIAETPENIKNILFKYYSGYTVSDYLQPKRPKPSVMPFITEYVNSYLMDRYRENNIAEMTLFNKIKNSNYDVDSSKKYEEIMKEYDNRCILNMNSNIYNIHEPETNNFVSEEQQKEKDVEKPQKKGVKKNEFAVSFDEQNK